MLTKAGAPKRLLKSQEMSLLKDIKDAIDRRVENRIATARRFAVSTKNGLKIKEIIFFNLGSCEKPCQDGGLLLDNIQEQ